MDAYPETPKNQSFAYLATACPSPTDSRMMDSRRMPGPLSTSLRVHLTASKTVSPMPYLGEQWSSSLKATGLHSRARCSLKRGNESYNTQGLPSTNATRQMDEKQNNGQNPRVQLPGIADIPHARRSHPLFRRAGESKRQNIACLPSGAAHHACCSEQGGVAEIRGRTGQIGGMNQGSTAVG
jgi:hypothetical protein